MAIFAISDLHLSFNADKPMDVFGDKWSNYTEKLKENWNKVVGNSYTVIIPGDTSWAMYIDDALEDFEYINSLNGRKIILKGNHDYWWTTSAKTTRFFEENGINTIDILHNNSFSYGGIGICGTRGWFFEECRDSEHDKKMINREVMRLEASLVSAGDREKYVFLHYPPKFYNYECPEILALLAKYEVSHCFYGHIHGTGCAFAFNGRKNNTDFALISADHLNFRPKKLID